MCSWAENPKRKPLVLRGARQVDKTTIVEPNVELYDFESRTYKRNHHFAFSQKNILFSTFHFIILGVGKKLFWQIMINTV